MPINDDCLLVYLRPPLPGVAILAKDGATLKGEAELIDGDNVQIGDTVFRFEVS